MIFFRLLTCGGHFKYASIDGYRHEANKKDDWISRLDNRGHRNGHICRLRASCASSSSGHGGFSLARISGIGFNLHRTLRGRKGARTFFTQIEREKGRKLVEHYHRLNDYAFGMWSKSTSNRISQVTGCGLAPSTLYLASNLLLEPQEPHQHLYQLAMEHIKTGYPKLQTLFDELRVHEDRNNQQASALVETIEREIDHALEVLRNLPTLQPIEVLSSYDRNAVIRAIYETTQLSLVDIASISPMRDLDKIRSGAMTEGSSKLVDAETAKIASGADSAMTRLKNEIESLRTRHRNDFDALKVNAEHDEELVKAIRDKVTGIVSEIEDMESLKGECAYEKSLG
jgi:hypothetical protein